MPQQIKMDVSYNTKVNVTLKAFDSIDFKDIVKKVNDNFDNVDDPDFAPNPSRAVIRNNVCVCYNDYGFFVAESVRKLGTIENNLVFSSEDECIVPGSKYELKPEVKKQLPEFKDIPVDEIGLYKK